MEFDKNQAIYLQISDKICTQVLLDTLKEQSRLLSVRELAVQLEVNPNTVVKSYANLEQEKIIYKKRGIGYFVADNAKQLILIKRREVFINQTLAKLFEEMEQLDISMEDVRRWKEKSL